MNVILVSEADYCGPSTVRLEGRRLQHVTKVLRAGLGHELRVGLLGGALGTGRVVALDDEKAELEISLDIAPPAPLPLALFLALPRPKAIPRVLQMAANLGVKRIFLFNSYRVEKIYWSCQQLGADEMLRACVLGLEQARDTVLPEIKLCRLFKPFVEDELPELIKGTEALVAHPAAQTKCPFDSSRPVSLAIGPEGGFIDYELALLERAGFTPVRSVERILKVETAVASLIGRLF